MKWDKLYLVAQRVDMRLGVEGLSLFIQQQLGGQPCDGSAYVFCNSRRNRIKVVVWDGNGVWLCYRRLHRGCFTWVDRQQEQVHLCESPPLWSHFGVGVKEPL